MLYRVPHAPSTHPTSRPNLHVSDLVSEGVLDRLHPGWRDLFSRMRIVWLPNRVWGLSFQFGDKVVRVGHKKGHHIAQHPEVHGISEETAETILRLEVEGTLLHELGHALFDAHRGVAPAITTAFQGALESNGPVSSYEGMDVNAMSADDVLHENVAEAVRWYLMGSRAFVLRYPHWCLFAAYLTRQVPQSPHLPPQ